MATASFTNLDKLLEDEEKKKKVNSGSSSQSGGQAFSQSKSGGSNLDSLASMTAPKPSQTQQVVETPAPQKTGFLSKVVDLGKKAVKGTLDLWNSQKQKSDIATFEMQQIMYGKPEFVVDATTGKKKLTTQTLENFKKATPEEKARLIDEENQKAPIMKALNSDSGRKVLSFIGENTSNIPLKAMASLKAIGDDTYDEAYAALQKDRQNPENGAFKSFLYEIQDSGIQSMIGVVLSLGTTYLTRNPTAGRTVGMTYYAGISAAGQQKEKGRVESLGNIAIDTVGDQILGSSLEGIFKGGKGAIISALKSAGIEGTTEVTQTFLKYANDYSNANNEEEKQKILAEAKRYVVEGGMLMEFSVGSVAGGVIGAGTEYVAPSMTIDIKGSGGEEESKKEPKVGDIIEQSQDAPKKGEPLPDNYYSNMRDQLSQFDSALASGEAEMNDENFSGAAALRARLDEYLTLNKDKTFFLPERASVETVQFDDGKYVMRFSANVGENSVTSPFITQETFNTQKEATEAGLKQIQAWIKEQRSSAQSTQEKRAYSKLLDDMIQNSNKSEDNFEDIVTKQPEENTKLTDTVERTPDGTYRVTQYTQKGEAQGKAEARYTRSKKTGKLYLEIFKDGERIERLSLERAKKVYETTNRGEMVERAVNGRKNENGKWELRQSNAPVIRNTSQNQAEKKPVKTKGEVKNSKAFQRVQDRLGEFADIDVNYNRLNLAEDTARALEFIEKFPKDAKRIALGMQGAPEGVTETAISIALAEQASENKDYALQAQLERSRSLRQTRRGQEIVSERGRFNENSAHFFMQQVLAARLEKAGKTTFKFFTKKGDSTSSVVEGKIKEGTESAKTAVRKKLSSVEMAQSVIDKLTC